MVEGAVLVETPKTTLYRQVERGVTFQTKSQAAVAFSGEDPEGKPKTVVLNVNLASSDIPALIKPHYISIVPPPAACWVVVTDYYGEDQKFLVNDPQGENSGGLPSVLWAPVNTSDVAQTFFSPTDDSPRISQSEATEWHQRLLDPCPERLEGTLREMGVSAPSLSTLRQISSNCDLCQRKNAVVRKAPRSTSRRNPQNEFNHKVVWDLGHIHEVGYKGEHFISVLVEEATLWWDLFPLRKKSDAPDHLLKWIYEAGAPKGLSSDNAGELKGQRVRIICEKQDIHLITTPPYDSEAQGVVERQIRDLRGLLRAALARLSQQLTLRQQRPLPFSIWPALLPGIADLHNKTWSRVLGKSPWVARYGFAPSFSLVLGDRVIMRRPAEAKGPKTLALPGIDALFLSELNSSTALVYAERERTVIRVHPSKIRLAKTDSTAVSPTPVPGLVAHPPAPVSSSIRVTTVTEEEEDKPPAQPLLPYDAAIPPPPASPDLPPPPSVAPPSAGPFRPAASVTRMVTRSYDPNTSLPRFDPPAGDLRPSLLAYTSEVDGHRSLTPAIDLGLTAQPSRGTHWVSWLQPIGDNQWTQAHLGTVRNEDIDQRFEVRDAGAFCTLPESALTRLAEVQSSEQADALLSAVDVPSDSATFATAILREFVSNLQHDVLGPEVAPTKKGMKMAWLLTMKQGEKDQLPTPKARWYCKGFMDDSPGETYAGTPDADVYRLFLIYTLSRGWGVQHIDAETAFLQAPISPDVNAVVILDDKLPTLPAVSPFPSIDSAAWKELRAKAATLRPGQYRQLRRALYGDRRAPFLWGLKLRQELSALGYVEVAESLFLRYVPRTPDPVAIVMAHVDDMAAGGEEVGREVAAIRERIRCKPPVSLIVGQQQVFLGTSVRKTSEGIELSNDHYVTRPTDVRPQTVRAIDLEAPREDEVDLTLEKEYRSLNGQLGWVVKTRPDQAVYFSMLSKHCSKPSQKLLKTLKRVLLAIADTPCCLRFAPIVGRPRVVGYSDAAFKIRELRSRAGSKVFLRGEGDDVMDIRSNIVMWLTREIKILHDSSTSGELLALKGLVKAIPSVINTVKAVWGVEPSIVLFIDNHPLRDQVKSGKCKQEPSMQQHLDYVIQEVARLGAELKWIPRESKLQTA
eukprot:GHVU01128902.1.p1 GENE.GHVU01128902.1~~GHVU01128902.1.p1  ORF type:complete len:1138 (+),score=128.93 GHVU01128902.1:635-4048(+)